MPLPERSRNKMASSSIEICNQALMLLGDKTIADFNEDSAAAKLCSTLYPLARDAVLRLHPWNCAVKRVKLTPKSQTPEYGYANAFTLPPNLLRLLSIDGLTDYKVEGREILSDSSSISVRYIYRNENVNEYDSLLVEAMSGYLAYKLAYPITKSSTVREEMKAIFGDLLKLAKSVDAQEEPQDTIGDFTLLNVRR